MTLSVKDIVNDLGVINITVWRWIKEGQIKATMVDRRHGWIIEEEDYIKFLDNHSRYRLIHNGEIFSGKEIRMRETVLASLISSVIASKSVVKNEQHSKEYMEGFNRAVTDITQAINKEIRKKVPDSEDSRSEQIA